jgi:hypothetical protein
LYIYFDSYFLRWVILLINLKKFLLLRFNMRLNISSINNLAIFIENEIFILLLVMILMLINNERFKLAAFILLLYISSVKIFFLKFFQKKQFLIHHFIYLFRSYFFEFQIFLIIYLLLILRLHPNYFFIAITFKV